MKGGSLMFEDRKDAGKRLAESLEKYRDHEATVLAIPRGGVPVGFQVANELDKEFSILVSRKLPIPDNPEAGFGALAEDGSQYILSDADRWIPEEMIGKIVEEQKKVIQERISNLRDHRRFPDIEGKTVILVDDGIAMGSTMKAAIEMCKNRKAEKIVVAVPVSGTSTAREISGLVDELIVLETPPNFQAVAQVYNNWHDVTDQEVIAYLG